MDFKKNTFSFCFFFVAFAALTCTGHALPSSRVAKDSMPVDLVPGDVNMTGVNNTHVLHQKPLQATARDNEVEFEFSFYLFDVADIQFSRNDSDFYHATQGQGIDPPIFDRCALSASDPGTDYMSGKSMLCKLHIKAGRHGSKAMVDVVESQLSAEDFTSGIGMGHLATIPKKLNFAFKTTLNITFTNGQSIVLPMILAQGHKSNHNPWWMFPCPMWNTSSTAPQ